jgi:glycosyltransferase involved in cell wall biosynthesis
LRTADARIFTQDGYRRFFGIEKQGSLIAPAVWVDESNIISHAEQTKRLEGLPKDTVHLLFPARLVPDKGSDLVLAAVSRVELLLKERYESAPFRIRVDLIGAGPLEKDCRDFAAHHHGAIEVRFLDPVPYGKPFFLLLGTYHAIVLANRQEEQPRVIFDAFSQGVPVISSRTSGVCDIVKEGQNALLYDVDNADGLAQQILAFAADTALRQELSWNALDSVQGYSHLGMHQTREKFLKETLAL